MVERELIDLRKQCVLNLFSCVDNVSMFLNDEEKEKEFSQLRSCIEEYCVQDARQNVADQALEEAKAETDCTNLESLLERFNSHLSGMAGESHDLMHHPYMLELNKRIQKARRENSREFMRVQVHIAPDPQLHAHFLLVTGNLDESADLAITDTQERFIDPITKKRILDPVKNTVCGHVYERETIMKVINARKGIRCPVMGCGNRTLLDVLHLTSDDELRHRLELTQQQHLAFVSDRSINDLDASNS